jgi:hypothetical protein
MTDQPCTRCGQYGGHIVGVCTRDLEPVTAPPAAFEAQLAREVATADLYHAARQYAAVAAGVAHGDVSQELLHDREATLLGAALLYAAARDWTPPPPEAA